MCDFLVAAYITVTVVIPIIVLVLFIGVVYICESL